MCPSIPSSVQDAARFSALCPQKFPRCCPFFMKLGAVFALTLDRRLNQTILECADWGQITVSYTVLPLRRSFEMRPLTSVSTAFATPKKHRQINLIMELWGRLRGAHGALLAPTTGGLGEPPQQSEWASLRLRNWLLVHVTPLRLGCGAPLAASGAVELLGVRWKILKRGKVVALLARTGGAFRRLTAAEPRRSLLDDDATGAFPRRRRRRLGDAALLALARRHGLAEAPAIIGGAAGCRLAACSLTGGGFLRQPAVASHAGGDDRHPHALAQSIVEGRTDNDIGFRIDFLAHAIGGLVHLPQR